MQYSIPFANGTVQYLLQSSFDALEDIVPGNQCILLTDSNVYALYKELFQYYKTIVIPAGEENKNYETVQYIIDQLIAIEAHRKTCLVGVGGGMVTDITGFVGSIYMRGISFGFVPTTLLAMTDAAIGGKNGIDVGLHKNLVGIFRQPKFILYDTYFLRTLPDDEWNNGFAEIIKYACLFDDTLFAELSANDIGYYQQNKEQLEILINKCVTWKNKIVQDDETEGGRRKLLNFGHTAGHAIEKLYSLPHGYAVAMGMIVACIVSEDVSGLGITVKERLTSLLRQYHLPTALKIDIAQTMDLLRMDKKRNQSDIDYIVLEKIGAGRIETIPFDTVQKALDTFTHAGNH